MSDEQTENAIPEPPHSWVKLTAALSVLGFLAVIGVLLVRSYLATRPVNLIGVTENAAQSLEEVLIANRVPRDAIDVIGPERKRHPTAYWNAYEYDVRLPASVSLEGIRDVVEKRMHSESVNLSVNDYIDGGSDRGFSLNYGDVGFAIVRLHPAIVERPLPKNAPAAESPVDVKFELPTREDHAAAPATPFERFLDVEPLDAREWRPPTETPPVPEKPVQDAEKAKLAIILDDGGYGGPVTEDVLALPPQLTLAILPYTPAATKTANRAAEAGFEVILHMPMENLDPDVYPHQGQLLVDMGEDEIAGLTEKALEEVPHAVGINNHMGSRFTSDPAAMARFLTVLSKRRLYFIDSRTAATTKAYELAKTFGLPTEERDIFLDHVDEEDSIRRRFAQSVELAKAEGNAIAIGHFRVLTVSLLKELLASLDDEVQLVHVSELIE